MDVKGRNRSSAIQSEDEMDLRRGPWTDDEDFTLINYIANHGEGRWNSLARCAGKYSTGCFSHNIPIHSTECHAEDVSQFRWKGRRTCWQRVVNLLAFLMVLAPCLGFRLWFRFFFPFPVNSAFLLSFSSTLFNYFPKTRNRREHI